VVITPRKATASSVKLHNTENNEVISASQQQIFKEIILSADLEQSAACYNNYSLGAYFKKEDWTIVENIDKLLKGL
jgi:hypothetical protein